MTSDSSQNQLICVTSAAAAALAAARRQLSSTKQLLTEQGQVPEDRQRRHILTGYRLPAASVRHSVTSVFHLHNESGNIWTHLVSALYFVYTTAMLLSGQDISWRTADGWQGRQAESADHLTLGDKAFLTLQSVGGIAVFGFSACYHIMENHCSSPKWYFMDIFGMVFAVSTAYGSILHFGFVHTGQDTLYLAYMAAFVSAAAFTQYSLFSRPAAFDKRKELWLAGWIGSSLLPLAHLILLDDGRGLVALHLPAFVAGMVVAASGAVIFMTAFPEVCWPGRFDLIGNSHQLWHTCMFIFTAIALDFTTKLGNARHSSWTPTHDTAIYA